MGLGVDAYLSESRIMRQYKMFFLYLMLRVLVFSARNQELKITPTTTTDNKHLQTLEPNYLGSNALYLPSCVTLRSY